MSTDPLTLTPTLHPDLRVREVGFDLTHPYVEQCWAPILGPSATLLLRRLPTIWADHVPATISRDDLARSLGLGNSTGDAGRLMRTLDRITHHHIADWHQPGRSLDVYLRIPALSHRQLERVTPWTHQAHERLLDAHINDLTATTGRTPVATRLDLTTRRATARPGPTL